MAAGTFVVANKAKLNMLNATNLAGQTTFTNYKVALCGTSYTPAGTEEVWADISANEIANGNGYTTGGAAASSGSLSGTSGTVTFSLTFAIPTFTATGSGIPAWKYAVIYYSGTLNGKVNPVVGWFEGNSGSTVPLTAAADTITITTTTGVFTFA